MLRYLWALPNTIVGVLFLPAAMVRGGHMQVMDGVLEACGPLLSALLRCVPIGGGAAAITFGHIVLGRDHASLEWTRGHERVHVRQCEIWGPLFIPAYLTAALWAFVNGRGAYIGNYFELQALREDMHAAAPSWRRRPRPSRPQPRALSERPVPSPRGNFYNAH